MEYKSFYAAVKAMGVVSYATALRRVRKGKSPEEALSVPAYQDKEKPCLPGTKFDRLTVIKREVSARSRDSRWLCQCNCGNQVIVLRKNLIDGKTKSCGCWRREVAQSRAKAGKEGAA